MQNVSEYSHDSISRELDNLGLFDVKLSFFEEIASTNVEMKEYCISSGIPEKPLIFVAKQQSAGKGRLGKSFVSLDAGVYDSFLFPCEEYGADLTARVAVMVSEAIEELSGIETDIKWVNDVYFSGRKLAGILCEGIVNPESLRLEAVIIGIGINVLKTDFPKEISDIAVSLADASGKSVSRSELVALLAEKIFRQMPTVHKDELIKKYKSKSTVIGKMLTVLRAGESFSAKAIDINEKAELVVLNEDGQIIALNTGEVSIKLN